MNRKPIGLFDSGMGGLTVAKAIKSLLPLESIFYFGDLAHMPYGSKGSETVKQISEDCARFLHKQGIKLLVIACNTSTSIALEHIQNILDIPVIGVISPGASEACKSSETKRVGVIGTKRTISSNAYYESILKLDPSFRVFQQSTPLLVPLIEEGWSKHPAFYLILEEYLKYFDDKDIDALVLGCTHYPLIKKEIKLLRPNWNVVDSASATALEVEKLLKKQELLSDSKEFSDQFFASDISETFVDLSENIMNGFVDIKKVEV